MNWPKHTRNRPGTNQNPSRIDQNCVILVDNFRVPGEFWLVPGEFLVDSWKNKLEWFPDIDFISSRLIKREETRTYQESIRTHQESKRIVWFVILVDSSGGFWLVSGRFWSIHSLSVTYFYNEFYFEFADESKVYILFSIAVIINYMNDQYITYFQVWTSSKFPLLLAT